MSNPIDPNGPKKTGGVPTESQKPVAGDKQETSVPADDGAIVKAGDAYIDVSPNEQGQIINYPVSWDLTVLANETLPWRPAWLLPFAVRETVAWFFSSGPLYHQLAQKEYEQGNPIFAVPFFDKAADGYAFWSKDYERASKLALHAVALIEEFGEYRNYGDGHYQWHRDYSFRTFHRLKKWGDQLRSQERWDEALWIYEKAMELDDKHHFQKSSKRKRFDFIIFILHGDVEIDAGNYAKAIDALETASTLSVNRHEEKLVDQKLALAREMLSSDTPRPASALGALTTINSAQDAKMIAVDSSNDTDSTKAFAGNFFVGDLAVVDGSHIRQEDAMFVVGNAEVFGDATAQLKLDPEFHNSPQPPLSLRGGDRGSYQLPDEWESILHDTISISEEAGLTEIVNYLELADDVEIKELFTNETDVYRHLIESGYAPLASQLSVGAGLKPAPTVHQIIQIHAALHANATEELVSLIESIVPTDPNTPLGTQSPILGPVTNGVLRSTSVLKVVR